jgi:hypothetical protein
MPFEIGVKMDEDKGNESNSLPLLSPILSLSHSFHLGGPIKTDIKARIAF